MFVKFSKKSILDCIKIVRKTVFCIFFSNIFILFDY